MLPVLEARAATQSQVLAFCGHLRLAGIGTLFLTGTPEVFHQRLKQSGEAFAWFLQGAEVLSKQTGSTLPFFDAIAAGDMATAGEVAREARHSWAQGEEYEEDFLFVEFLMQRFFLGASQDTCERLLARYEQALQGAEDIRLPLCQALVTRDAEGFEESLKGFLSERDDRFESNANSESPERLATEALLSVEGLALVRLAEREGFPLAEDYLHVPSVALEGRAPSLESNSWRRLE
ncbi:Imm49 family immunity protein [Corallococcus llansteffanensis]|uniref:Imm49 family immunity protein n=1 Tax=Corallococcus llansteffanensis TaxID=2316731 RepID=UPI001315A3B8|nr:Imm49 family immunity protein [Corallococcus llansteffanensis]